MRYKRLGKTDLVVSELGFGAFAIGGNKYGNSYGHTDDNDSINAICVALELGCNFFDTADVYGHGHSEVILGTALRHTGKLHEVVIASKGGCNFQHEPVGLDFSRDYLFSAVDASLRRLGRDYIDLYQLHNPPITILEHSDVFDTLDRLKATGKIRHYGVSIHTVDEGLVCIKSGKPETLQIVYNLFSQLQPGLSAEALLAHISKAHVGLIAREPLANGFLSGKHSLNSRYEEGDIRAEFSMEERRLRVALSKSLLYLQRPGISAAQLALRFVLDEAPVSTTIVGIKTAAQAKENFGAVDLPPFADLYVPPSDKKPQTVNINHYEGTTMPKEFVFTITTGRSGTLFLTELFKRNMRDAEIYHERINYDSFGVHTPDISQFMLFNSLGNVKKVRDFWYQKLRADAKLMQKWYIETSHMLVKAGLLENIDILEDLGHKIHVIILKRNEFQIFWSLVNRGEFRLLGGHTWLHWLDPRYHNRIVDSTPFIQKGEWGCVMWYITEMFTRAEYYKLLLADKPCVQFHEMNLEDIVTPDGAANKLSELGMLSEASSVDIPPRMNERKDDYLSAYIKSQAQTFYDSYSFDCPALARQYYDSGWRLSSGGRLPQSATFQKVF